MVFMEFVCAIGLHVSAFEFPLRALPILVQEDWQAHAVVHVCHRTDLSGLEEVSAWIAQADQDK